MAQLKAGTRLKSSVCATEIMVIAAPAEDTALTCGGADVIDRSCAALPPDVTGLLPVALQLFEWWPFFGELRFRRFSQLEPSERDDSLRGWMTSRLGTRRLAFYALRNLALLGYWSQEQTWPLIDYRGPLIASANAEAAA